MKRTLIIALFTGVLITLLAGTSLASPAADPPQPNQRPTAGMGLQRGMPAWAGLPDAVEQLLGMTEDQIETERQAGKSLVQIAQSKGITEETLISTILNAKKAEQDKLVAAGTITQARADVMYQQMQQQVPVMVNRTTTGPAVGQAQGQSTQPAGRHLGKGFGPGAMHR